MLGLRLSTSLVIAAAAATTAALCMAPIAGATTAAGALNCPLAKYNPTKYALQRSQPVTCTIDGASDASGLSTVTVYVKSSDVGNSAVTGTVSGSGSSTTVTFTYTGNTGGCNTVVVAYGSLGNNANNSKITPGGTAAAGFAFVDANGNGITTCGAPPPPPPPSPTIYLGYADTYATHGDPSGFPWNGMSPTPLVIGCGVDPNGGGAIADICPLLAGTTTDSYDAGVIRIDNTSSTASMPVTGASVTIGACTYNPWAGLNISIPAGGSLVLTQTGGANPCPSGGNVVGNYNFDTSEAYFGGSVCGVNDGLVPAISLTINGTPMTVNDTGQILNTGGYDPGSCGLSNEYHAFVQVSP
jgi:hypothetical protein